MKGNTILFDFLPTAFMHKMVDPHADQGKRGIRQRHLNREGRATENTREYEEKENGKRQKRWDGVAEMMKGCEGRVAKVKEERTQGPEEDVTKS